MHICSLSNIHKRRTVVNTPGAFFEKYFAGARQRPRGHLVPRISISPSCAPHPATALPQRVLVALVPLHEFGDAVDGFLVDHIPLIRQQHQIKVHHAGMQFCYRFDFAILAFLQLRREHILEPVRLVERKWNRLVICIDH